MVAVKEFREDLFYRISVIPIILPPLRDRKSDIALLIDSFLERFNKDKQHKVKGLDPTAMSLLRNYDWPGNVRELKNVVERLILLSGTSKTIEVQHIPSEILADIHPGLTAHSHTKLAKLTYAIKAVEKTMVFEELKKANWNKTYAARALGISRASLNNKIAEFNIQPHANF